ncbi:MAG: thermonuclease family protein [Candidatus Methylomirabilota bacterium]
MLTKRRLLSWLSALACLALAVPAFPASPRSIVTTVQGVADGDTVTAISANGTKLRIRLLGIDAPEIPHGKKPGQPYGEEARDYLEHLIGGKTVRLDTYGPDRYKRVLAVVWDEQTNVNLLMVAMGYAEVYRGAPCQVYCRELEQAEAKAKTDKVGMWAQGAGYETPAAFRKRMQIRGD